MVDIQTVKKGDYLRIINFKGMENIIGKRELNYLYHIVKVHSVIDSVESPTICITYEGKSGHFGFNPFNLGYTNEKPQDIYAVIG